MQEDLRVSAWSETPSYCASEEGGFFHEKGYRSRSVGQRGLKAGPWDLEMETSHPRYGKSVKLGCRFTQPAIESIPEVAVAQPHGELMNLSPNGGTLRSSISLSIFEIFDISNALKSKMTK